MGHPTFLLLLMFSKSLEADQLKTCSSVRGVAASKDVAYELIVRTQEVTLKVQVTKMDVGFGFCFFVCFFGL